MITEKMPRLPTFFEKPSDGQGWTLCCAPFKDDIGHGMMVCDDDGALVFMGYEPQEDTKRMKPLDRAKAYFPKANFMEAALLVPNRIRVHGTDFQCRVWEALLGVGQGKTITYGQLARRVDKPKAVRAVGTAVGANPVSPLIPCHRIVPAAGGIGNYGWGSDVKSKLLKAESA